jgi:hypothetical protein
MDDKRQITAMVASALDGTLLPLQLIFTGKSPACVPKHTDDSEELGFHLTRSENHWSSQETMQQWVEHIIVPHRLAMIGEHTLKADAHIILLLDVWAVHISKLFRSFLAEQHPYIHLLYIPANCTSKLQVADFALNFPFKHGFKRRFNEWAAKLVDEQIRAGKVVGIKPFCGMTLIKPKVLEWALESWKSLAEERGLIKTGWEMCVARFYDVNNQEKRIDALRQAILSPSAPPPEPEPEPEEKESDEPNVDEDGFNADSSEDEDLDKSEKQIMREKVQGTRKSSRSAPPPKPHGYMLNSSQLKFS